VYCTEFVEEDTFEEDPLKNRPEDEDENDFGILVEEEDEAHADRS
jgi:hypothetical protein